MVTDRALHISIALGPHDSALCIASSVGWWMNNNKFGKNWPWSNRSSIPSFCLEVPSKVCIYTSFSIAKVATDRFLETNLYGFTMRKFYTVYTLHGCGFQCFVCKKGIK